jgi:hypothetical protein
VLALHDGVVIREVVGAPTPASATAQRGASDLERTALLMLLRSAIAD